MKHLMLTLETLPRFIMCHCFEDRSWSTEEVQLKTVNCSVEDVFALDLQ